MSLPIPEIRSSSPIIHIPVISSQREVNIFIYNLYFKFYINFSVSTAEQT